MKVRESAPSSGVKGKNALPDKDEREEIKQNVIEEFKVLWDSDRQILEEGEDNQGTNFEKLHAQMMLGKMESHDKQNAKEGYYRSAMEGLITHHYLPLEDRVKAGFARERALFEKDESEKEFYRIEEGEERPSVDGEAYLGASPWSEEELKEGDDSDYVSGVFTDDIRDIKADIESEDLGVMSGVYEAFYEEASLTIGNIFESMLIEEHGKDISDEKAEEIADQYAQAAAYFETKAYFLNKTQEEIEGMDRHHNDEAYFEDAWHLKAKAATQNLGYPERRRNGGGQSGGLGAEYPVMVNLHDNHDMHKILKKQTALWAETLKESWRDFDDMRTEYPAD